MGKLSRTRISRERRPQNGRRISQLVHRRPITELAFVEAMSVGQEKGAESLGLERSQEILTRAILLQAAQLALSANCRCDNGAVAFRRFCHVGRLRLIRALGRKYICIYICG